MSIFSSKKESNEQDIRDSLLMSLSNIRKETELLEKSYQKTSASIEELKQTLDRNSVELHNGLLILDKNLSITKRKLSFIIYEFKRNTATLNYVVKKEELETLKRKIDLWSPENVVTKREFTRMIEGANKGL